MVFRLPECKLATFTSGYCFKLRTVPGYAHAQNESFFARVRAKLETYNMKRASFETNREMPQRNGNINSFLFSLQQKTCSLLAMFVFLF